MKTDYSTDTLILGATFYGCGLAAAVKNSLLVDSSISVGSDYAFAFLQGKNWSQPSACAESEEFRQELLARYALENDRILPAALAPALAVWCTTSRKESSGAFFLNRKSAERCENSIFY